MRNASGRFAKGNPGKPKGSKSKRTQQWDAFADWMMEDGLVRFREEMKKLRGKEYVQAMTSLMEFFRPRISRSHQVQDVRMEQSIIYLPERPK